MEDEMEDIWQTEKLKDIPGHIKDFIKVQVELARIKAIEKISKVIALFLQRWLFYHLFTIILFFISVAGGLWLGRICEDNAIGFLFIALFYLIVGVIVFIFKKNIVLNPIINFVIKLFHTNNENE
jgi:hypothetical protein